MDIKAILKSNNIDFIEQGKNVAEGNVYVRCPWCTDDPSHHMGIHLTTAKWGCWRNARHRGRDLAKLLAAILHISYDIAKTLVTTAAEPDRLDEAIDRLNNEHDTTVSNPTSDLGVVWDTWCMPIRAGDHVTAPFYEYLSTRGLPDVDLLAKYFDLRAGVSGQFNRRILFPIKTADGTMVGWTGRAIGPSQFRYLSHPRGPIVKRSLLFHNLLREQDRMDKLVITEGPFDALKLYWAGIDLRWGATCVFGRVPTIAQETQLLILGSRFKQVIVAFDADAWDATLRLCSVLSSVGATPALLPAADPGFMSFGVARKFLADYGSRR